MAAKDQCVDHDGVIDENHIKFYANYINILKIKQIMKCCNTHIKKTTISIQIQLKRSNSCYYCRFSSETAWPA